MTVKVKRIDPYKYGQLLLATLPRPIQTEAENERALELINRLMSKGENKLTKEEGVLLDLLTVLVERFEEEHYPIPAAPPHAVLQMLMEDRNLRHKDLMPVLGSRGVTSEVIGGKRLPSKAQAKALSEFFKVSPELFVSHEF